MRKLEEGNGARRGGRMSALVDRAQQSVAGGVDCSSRNPRESFTSKLTTGKAGCWHLCRAASRRIGNGARREARLFGQKEGLRDSEDMPAEWTAKYDAANDGLMIAAAAAAAAVAAMSNSLSILGY